MSPIVYGTTANEPDLVPPEVKPGVELVPVVQKTVAENEILLLAKLLLMNCPKLTETVAPAAMDLGPTRVTLIELTPPDGMLTQTVPHTTSKLSDGLVLECPVIRMTTLTPAVSGLFTVNVQL